MPRVPEPEALEQHPATLAPFRDAVQPPIQIEVLEGGQLPVDERLVREVADAPALDADLQRATGRGGETGAETEERRLSRPVRTRDQQEPVVREIELHTPQHALVSVPLLEGACVNH